MERFPPKIENKTKISSLTTPTQHCTGFLVGAIRQEKENKIHTDRKGKNKIVFIF